MLVTSCATRLATAVLPTPCDTGDIVCNPTALGSAGTALTGTARTWMVTTSPVACPDFVAPNQNPNNKAGRTLAGSGLPCFHGYAQGGREGERVVKRHCRPKVIILPE